MKTIESPLSIPACNERHKTLLTHAELLPKLDELSVWKKEAWEEFSSRVSSPEFPCLFSKRAWSSKSIHLLFCDADEHNGYYQFLHGLIAYTDMINATPVNKRMFSPLVVFFAPDISPSLSGHELGWDILNWTHQHDIYEWPSHVPREPESSEWTYCFNGVELFINMSTNQHHQLKNRNLGSHLNFVVNAREIFDIVANGETKGGRQARERIRSRVKNYNDGLMPTELGFYGDEENLEWRQYQLQETNVLRPSQCPFKSHK
ncbi:YqcI/YcgG family protein [Vibrio cyclitrophicus]|uniref:YqcI/YcgG family protein n=1 Tax=Vibrio cyclitrophicus ZF270 TaxID=1136176 RepID=A0AAN0LJL9_9VIBR|nr:YqcI/YcgG family protein [Vibrio cyclitrophicus]